MNELRTSVTIESVDADDPPEIAGIQTLSIAVQNLHEVLQDEAVVLLGKAQQLAGSVQLEQEIVVDGRHIYYTHVDTVGSALIRSAKRFVNTTPAAHDES
jgi:hypothetical protein